MNSAAPQDRDALLMMLSAYLDGELTASEEQTVLDALSQNPDLIEAFEAMSAARLVGSDLSRSEADELTAGILAATAPAEMADSAEGALALASMAADDALDAAATARLDQLLPRVPDAVHGFVASLEATQQTLRAVSSIPLVAESLRSVPDHVDAQVAAAERVGALCSAALDDALTPAELAELGDRVDEHVAYASFAGEALRVASSSPAFARLGAKAGAAALHAIDAEARQAAVVVPAQPVERVSIFASFTAFFSAARAPLAFAGAAAALFFVLKTEGNLGDGGIAKSDAAAQELLNAASKVVLAEAPVTGDLPLLADNSADVEAIDTTGTTVVFSTESSNITVIWVAAEDDEEQGT